MKHGFTLLELLIVIGILAILAAVVTVVLNPAELLKQARDAQRVSDLTSLSSALGMYLADVTSPSLGTSTLCYVNSSAATTNCSGRHSGKTLTYDVDRTVDGAGWIPVNLTTISSGSPLPLLPTDPTNDATYFYSYVPSIAASSTWEIDAKFESTKYTTTMDLDGKDGGAQGTDIYETGTQPKLDF